jgi:hypothetical protein
MEHTGLDRVQHLGHEPEEADARRAVALSPVAIQAHRFFRRWFFRRWFFALCDEVLRVPHAASA